MACDRSTFTEWVLPILNFNTCLLCNWYKKWSLHRYSVKPGVNGFQIKIAMNLGIRREGVSKKLAEKQDPGGA